MDKPKCQTASCDGEAKYVGTRRPEFSNYRRYVRICEYHAHIEPVSNVYSLEPISTEELPHAKK